MRRAPRLVLALALQFDTRERSTDSRAVAANCVIESPSEPPPKRKPKNVARIIGKKNVKNTSVERDLLRRETDASSNRWL